jgi:hypothetical protein
MGTRTIRRSFVVAFSLALALPFLPTQALVAQEEAPGATEERILAFARVHLAIAEARDDLHQDLARYHEVDGRNRARERADQRIADAMASQGVEPREYEEFIAAVSFDADLMEAFQEALTRARGGPTED